MNLLPRRATKRHGTRVHPSRHDGWPAMAVLQPGHAAVIRPIHLVASIAAANTLFTVGIAIAG